MPIVTEKLLSLLRAQIEAHHTVVWYDPPAVYRDVARSLHPSQVGDAAIFCYEPERGFFDLRHRLEPLWQGTEPPRLLIYVPLEPAQTRHALIELEVAGCVMRPGQQPPERNTSLSAVARLALAPVLPPAAREEVLAQVEAGQLRLADLDQIAEKGAEAQAGAVALIYGTGNAAEIALRFLCQPALDAELDARQAWESLAGLLQGLLGVSLPAAPATLRAALARQILLTDLWEAWGEARPPALQTFPVAAPAPARQAAVQLAQTWRNRRDGVAAYQQWADHWQSVLEWGALALSWETLARSETFAAGEARLQQAVETALTAKPTGELVTVAEQRRAGFWAAGRPELKARWEVIATAGQVLLEAARVEAALRSKPWSAGGLLAAYALGEQPWCALDTAQRHLERDARQFDPDTQQHQALLQLIAKARQRYAAVAERLAERFLQAYADEEFTLPNVLLQADIYRDLVAPLLRQERVAYLLVDALRFEMARELLTTLEPAWGHELTAALATPPTITEVGMAALLPGAEQGLTLTAGGGKLTVLLGDTALRTRQERLACLMKQQAHAGVVKLEQLAPLTDPQLGQTLKAAPLIVVTATEEIDGLCESNPTLARRLLDDVFNQLRRGLKTLFNLGVTAAVISADHGFLFGEKITSGEGLEAPGGQTVALKRRVWIGQGGAAHPGVLRQPLSAFGLGGDLELATPWGLAHFKVPGGAAEYFHGGLSLQELVVPVVTVRAAGAPAATVGAPVQWRLTPGSKTISTRFFSIIVEGEATALLPLEPPLVRVEARVGAQVVSTPISASYGMQEVTKDVQLQLDPADAQRLAANTITLMLTEVPAARCVTLHLLDATTGLSLARLDDLPLNLTF